MSKKGYSKKKYKKPVSVTENSFVDNVGYGGSALDSSTERNHDSYEAGSSEKKDSVLNVKKWFSNFTSHQNENEKITEENNKEISETDLKLFDNTSYEKEEDVVLEELESVYFDNNYKKVEEVRPVENKKTIIAEGVEINGNITLEGDLELFGKIKGNINALGDITFAEDAVMEGALKGNNFTMQDGNIDGDVELQNHVMIGNRSQIIGDVYALSLVSSGKIVGNIFIEDRIILNETSVVEGNIKAKQLEVRPGAVIKGQIEVN